MVQKRIENGGKHTHVAKGVSC